MTVSSSSERGFTAATCGQHLNWSLSRHPILQPATKKARALLPATYSRADAVANLQRTALLVAAFAQGRGDLLRVAMQDRLHQPYRMDGLPAPAATPAAGRTLPAFSA
jgi:homoserine kinase